MRKLLSTCKYHIVRDHIPLEQGLRLLNLKHYLLEVLVRDHIPLEQGLRPGRMSHESGVRTVRDHIPLEQGLRLYRAFQAERRRLSETIFH